MQKDIMAIAKGLPHVTEHLQWENDWVLKVGDKSFFITAGETSSGYSVKVGAEAFDLLCQQDGVSPAPYLARYHWVAVDVAEADWPLERHDTLIQDAYNHVMSTLSKKRQRELTGS